MPMIITSSDGVGASDVISTSTGKEGGQTKHGPGGGVMWILCCMVGGSMRVPKTVFTPSRSTRLEGGVP
jgi:hypothetical protein